MNNPSTMTIRIQVTDEERAMIQQAAEQSESGSVSRWAELNLVDLARVETSSSEPGLRGGA